MRHDNSARAIISWLSVRKLKVLGVLPVLVIFILMLVLNIHEPPALFEAPFVLAILNTIFLFAVPLVVAYMAAKSYRATGVIAFMLIGCGLVLFSVSNLYAGWVMPLAGNPNPPSLCITLGACLPGFSNSWARTSLCRN